MRVRVLIRGFLAVMVSALAVAGCTDSPISPSTPQFTSTDLVVGTGAQAAPGSLLTVHYTGWLYNPAEPENKGAIFDTSRGRDPFTFVVGIGDVIAGWDEGVPGMMAGGVRRLVIPPSLAYGGFRNGPIPPNASLLFEIQLVSVESVSQ